LITSFEQRVCPPGGGCNDGKYCLYQRKRKYVQNGLHMVSGAAVVEVVVVVVLLCLFTVFFELNFLLNSGLSLCETFKKNVG
jgi:hypothetical protein